MYTFFKIKSNCFSVVFPSRGWYSCYRQQERKMCSGLGNKNRSLWNPASTAAAREASKSWAVLWKFCPGVAWAAGEGGQGHSWKKSPGKNYPADQIHIWIQISSWPRGQWGVGPHGANHNMCSQPPNYNRMSPTLPYEPSRGGEEAPGCARAGEETPREGFRGKFSLPQQRLRITHHSLNPVRRVRHCDVLRRQREERQHPLAGLHQSCFHVSSSQYGKEEQCVSLWLHPADQHQQANWGHTQEREEEEDRKALPGTTKVEVQGDQGWKEEESW